jgi:glycosyltransferase involved in cell wall biosynthesis
MIQGPPSRVLITGGDPAGGLASFADSLAQGFRRIGICAEVVPPAAILARWSDLRNPDVLKILSTTAVFAAPFARRSLCVAHGFPRADVQGWPRLIAIVLSLRLAGRFSQLVAVSHYVAVHLGAIFNVNVHAVIHNPLHEVFFQPPAAAGLRQLITFAGRLHPCKRLDRILPAVAEILDENPGLRACIIGEGRLRGALQAMAAHHPRIEFTGPLPREQVRARLGQTRVFISACETEALGIAYLEALSQGCVVAMPACGGGLEIAPEEIGRSIRLLPLSLNTTEIVRELRDALAFKGLAPGIDAVNRYHPAAIAERYLEADRARRRSHPAIACGVSAERRAR